MRVLVLAEHNNQSMSQATAHVLTAARALGDEVVVLVAGFNCSTVADEVAQLAGVAQVCLVDAKNYEHALAENLSALIDSLLDSQIDNISALLAPATTFGKNVLPRVAAMRDVAQISDVTKIVGADTFEHPIYAGNAIETVRLLDKLKVLSIRTTAFDAVTDVQAPAQIDAVTIECDAENTQFVSASKPESTRPELTSASCVVSGGRGLQSAEQFQLIEALADALGAAVGASRAAVDAGFISNDHQVGQTGKIVAPALYIAVGISGAVQHLAGIKDAKVIVAINKDEEAPIFQVADYALVGDLFVVVPELIKKIKG
jgi:electron transfer flavoprotein alpha subunit